MLNFRRLYVAALVCAAPCLARAQSTEERINKAVALYTNFDIEGARPLLQEVLSPNYLQPISQEQRVRAYKYLGASYAVYGKRDSAAQYFQAALAYDAFTDLDRVSFSAAEQDAFELAKTQIFKLGIKPLQAKVIDPQSKDVDSSQFSFRIVTTQRAEITVSLILKRDSSKSQELFHGQAEGIRDILWPGTINNQRPDTGIYMFRVKGTSSQTGASTTPTIAQEELRVEHSFAPLEDTLRSLNKDTELLVETYKASDPFWDLGKGAFLGIAAAAIPLFILDKNSIASPDLGSWKAHWAIASGIGAATGLGVFSYRRSHLIKPDAVAENARRQLVRAQYNDGVKTRNKNRLDQTRLIIRPIGSTG